MSPIGASLSVTRITVDGTTLVIRPIAADDGPRLRALAQRCSPETLYLRFFSPITDISERWLTHFTDVDYDRRVALVATNGADIVGVARYDRTGETHQAEYAIIVEDAWQHRGLGTAMTSALIEVAKRHSVEELVAVTLTENTKVRAMLRTFSVHSTKKFVDGNVEMHVPIGDHQPDIAETGPSNQATSSAITVPT